MTTDHTRRSFLGTVGKTLAAGVGLALMPDAARADERERDTASLAPKTYTCCANASQCGGGCASGRVKFQCTSSGCPSYCTSCRDVNPNCYTFTSPGGCV